MPQGRRRFRLLGQDNNSNHVDARCGHEPPNIWFIAGLLHARRSAATGMAPDTARLDYRLQPRQIAPAPG